MPYLRHTITVDFSGDHDPQIVGVGIVIQESRQRGRRGPIVDDRSPYKAFELGEARVMPCCGPSNWLKRGNLDLQIRSDYNAMRRKLREGIRLRRTLEPRRSRRANFRTNKEVRSRAFRWVPRRKNQ